MEELAGCMWSYPESNEDLKHKLLCTTMELETAKKEASQAKEQSSERERQLQDLLKIAYKERDEARDQLQKVLNKFVPTSPSLIPAVLPQLHSDTPQLLPATKANSSITAESNSLTETYNTNSYGSSPATSNFFESVSSPEFSNFNVNDSNNVSNNESMTVTNYNLLSSSTTKIDHASILIDEIAQSKPLPQKGRLLEAVLQSGPLLHTLLVAGPLPRWRNPPPVQPFKMPTNSCQSIAALRKRSLTLSKPFVDMSCASSQLMSTSVLNFQGASSGSSCYANRKLLASPGFNFSDQIAVGKRQRLL